MGPHPEPHDVLAIANTERPVPQADARRKNGTMWVNLPELKARMEWIGPECSVRPSGPSLDMNRQAPKRFPEAIVRVGVHIFSGSTGLVRPAR